MKKRTFNQPEDEASLKAQVSAKEPKKNSKVEGQENLNLAPHHNGQLIELCIPSELGFEKIAMDTAKSVATRMGFSSERIEDLCTAIAEACTNAIEHGNQRNANMKVEVTLKLLEDALQVEIKDQGKNPLLSINRPLPVIELDTAERDPASYHLGIFLMNTLMDEVKFSAEPDGNRVSMLIHLVK